MNSDEDEQSNLFSHFMYGGDADGDSNFNGFRSITSVGKGGCKSVSITTNIVNGKTTTKKVTTIKKFDGTIEKMIEQFNDNGNLNHNRNKREKIR